MGVNVSAAKLFVREYERKMFSGRMLQLGKQDIFVTDSELDSIITGSKVGIGRYNKANVTYSKKSDLAKSRFISDDFLFKSLGFDFVESLDASPYEDCDWVFDLNQAEIPHHLQNKFDFIFDGGTLEHVFHVPNALANLTKMLKVGGRIFHIAPSSNHIDHGFYMFSPTLFWDYYYANQFDVNLFQVFRYDASNVYGGKWAMSNYFPGALTRVSLGGLDDGIYGLAIVVTKTECTTVNVVPQQGLYANVKWSNQEPDATMLGHDPRFGGKGLGLIVDEWI